MIPVYIINLPQREDRRISIVNEFSNKTIFNTTIVNPLPHEIPSTWIQGGFSHDNIEPFAGLFYWLAPNGKPYFLKATTLWDGISTKVIDPQDPNIVYCLLAGIVENMLLILSQK